jgi:hypothetical protein
MEWFEFAARLARDHGDLDIQVVVMPDKEDPFPAVLRSRDPLTGAFTGHYLRPQLHLNEIVASLSAIGSSYSGKSLAQLAVGSGPIDLSALPRGKSSD